MPDLETKIAQLKAENKKLKTLLKNAVRLLHKSREFLQHPGKPAVSKAAKRRVAKRPGNASRAARGIART